MVCHFLSREPGVFKVKGSGGDHSVCQISPAGPAGAPTPATPLHPAAPQATASDEPALLSRRIADALRDRIVTEEFAAGAHITERGLAAEFNVSRTPLREALKILAGDGLVALLPNRGAVVAKPGAAEIQERLDLLGVLEAFAGERAAVLASDAEIAEIRALHYEMRAAFERRDRRGYFHLNQQIHLALVAAARNRALSAVYTQLNHQLYAYRFRSSGNLAHWERAIVEHGQIVDALNERDAERLGTLLRVHLSSTWRQLAEGEGSRPREAQRRVDVAERLAGQAGGSPGV
jgi:DNA-binding GntR family transcriptional regulator